MLYPSFILVFVVLMASIVGGGTNSCRIASWELIGALVMRWRVVGVICASAMDCIIVVTTKLEVRGWHGGTDNEENMVK